MKTIAVTGGIGSGKSLAGKILSEMYFAVIDTDIITYNLSQKGNEGYKEIVKIFGESILNTKGEIDKKKLADIVFNDKKSLNMLNGAMHPIIKAELFKMLESLKKHQFVFVLIPLLFETDLKNCFDKIWLILADESIRIERASKRDNINKENVINRIKNQINYANMINLAHNVLYNNSSEEEFKVQVENALKTL